MLKCRKCTYLYVRYGFLRLLRDLVDSPVWRVAVKKTNVCSGVTVCQLHAPGWVRGVRGGGGG